jgi:hypothetical protein
VDDRIVGLLLALLFILLSGLEMTEADKARIPELFPEDIYRSSHDRFASSVLIGRISGKNERRPVLIHGGTS